jgi:hypothetical protein
MLNDEVEIEKKNRLEKKTREKNTIPVNNVM